MRLRDFFKRFRAKRVRQLSISDSVSFEAFYNESPVEKLNTKESSLTGDYNLSPAKLNIVSNIYFLLETIEFNVYYRLQTSSSLKRKDV